MVIHRKKERVWEIDALRGLLILCMLAWHLYFTVEAFCINGYYNIDPYKWIDTTDPFHCWFDWGPDGVIFVPKWIRILNHLIKPGVDTFFLISGVSCIFSRDNMRSTIRLLIAGFFMTFFTYGLYRWTGELSRFMRFGPLLCYAFCHLIYTVFLEKRGDKIVLLVAVIALATGYAIRYIPIHANTLLLFPLGIHPDGMTTGEYTPILPMLGWLLMGVLIGRKYYSEKKTIWPKASLDKATRGLQWLGRYSGYVYIGHIMVYTFGFTAAGKLLGIL